jgi:hypothetical protein
MLSKDLYISPPSIKSKKETWVFKTSDNLMKDSVLKLIPLEKAPSFVLLTELLMVNSCYHSKTYPDPLSCLPQIKSISKLNYLKEKLKSSKTTPKSIPKVTKSLINQESTYLKIQDGCYYKIGPTAPSPVEEVHNPVN